MPLSSSTTNLNATSATLGSPQSVYVDSSNNIYVPDFDNACIFKIPAGTQTVTAIIGYSGSPGSSLTTLDGPSSISLDSTYIYVADTNNLRIIRFSISAAQGDAGVVVADGSDGLMSAPYGVYYDSTSNYLYIADGGLHVILRWKPLATSGSVVAGVSGTSGAGSNFLSSPLGVYYDSTNKLMFVNDAGNSRIMVYCQNNSTGTVIAGTGKAGSTSTQLSFPYGFALDSSKNLYVADNGNQRIQLFARI
ncbi:unnamed protein product [Rotaria sp. Silwood2]|nr:unnamed protein product [Rotaria sp. Silwood2]CAF4095080.1 unnamed protein product [Rotaria sp. Silwood2]